MAFDLVSMGTLTGPRPPCEDDDRRSLTVREAGSDA